jgi:hypothetical protein
MKNLFTFIFLLSSFLSLANTFSDFPMGSNSSTPKLQERQQITLRSGVIFNARVANRPNAQTRTCTLGFAVKMVKRSGAGGSGGIFNQGYLTAGSCASTRGDSNGVSVFVIDTSGYEVFAGKIANRGGVAYNPKEGHDYAIIKIDPDY